MSSENTRPAAARRLEPDFRVRYRFFDASEGGRSSLPAQGYRPDWLYDGDDVADGLWCIHPEFEDEDGSKLEPGERARRDGHARMTILNAKLRGEIHQKRIRVGTRGFIMEGPKRVAEAIVVEILALETNPAR